MIITLLATSFPNAAEPTAVDLEFFETKVRPLLHEHCFSCHSAQAKSVKGGLRLDSRMAAIRGGESGAAVVVGATSYLVAAHEPDGTGLSRLLLESAA